MWLGGIKSNKRELLRDPLCTVPIFFQATYVSAPRWNSPLRCWQAVPRLLHCHSQLEIRRYFCVVSDSGRGKTARYIIGSRYLVTLAQPHENCVHLRDSREIYCKPRWPNSPGKIPAQPNGSLLADIEITPGWTFCKQDIAPAADCKIHISTNFYDKAYNVLYFQV